MSAPKTASLTFLFTDIEGSTRLLQQLGNDYAGLLEEHNRLLSTAVAEAGGRVFGSEGDALFAAFDNPSAALTAAVAGQRALAAARWPQATSPRVRMGVHSGETVVVGDNYVGLALHQAARITNAGHGGQVLVSDATRRLVGQLPAGLALRDLGERRLKDLAQPERLHQLQADGLATDFPALRTLDARPNNLPVQLTSFVGREELAAARAALAETRLLTLSGPGGTGKTRLALQLAAEASDEFPDGVWFVPLEHVREPDLVAPAIVARLGLTDSAGRSPLEELTAHLRDRRVLLVLDNLEQVVEAGTQLAQLLRDAPELKMVVTSRTVLRVYGEREFPVPPLGLPSETAALSPQAALGSEAVRLFVERARAVQPAFMLDEGNVEAVVDIARRLDGLPLAIELAAARVRILPVAALRNRLDSRLATLTGGARDLPARQQTLRGAIDWSHELLEPPERLLFRRFAALAGGGFLEQIEQVCGPAQEIGQDVLEGCSGLAEKSLLRTGLVGQEEPRFSMLATLQEYARERLTEAGEAELLAERQALAYLELVERCAPSLTGGRRRLWLDRLSDDHDNLRQAASWLTDTGRTAEALRFIVAAWRYWQSRGHLYEARERVDAVLAMDDVEAQPAELRARALGAAGSVCYWQGDDEAAYAYYARALTAARASGDEAVLAEALYNHGFAATPDRPERATDTYKAGRPYLEEALALYRRLADAQGVANASWAVSIASAADGDFAEALRFGSEARVAYRRLDDSFGLGWADHMLGSLHMAQGELDEAEEMFREALLLFQAASDLPGVMLLLADLALLADKRGDSSRYWRLGGAADRLRRETGAGLVEQTLEFFEWRAPVPPEGDPQALSAWHEGAAMSTDEAVAYALGEGAA